MVRSLVKKIICSAAVCSLFAAAFAKGSASVISATGKVEVQRNQKWVSVKAGDTVSEGELLNTGFKSEAVLKYEGSVLKMGPMTRITLEKLSSTPSKDTVSVYIKTGAIHSNVSHVGKKVQQTTHSAVAVASVRGTDYSQTAAGDITVGEGAVDAAPASMFNAAVFGIENPADGSVGATPEQVQAAEGALPADGESNPNTNAADINPVLAGANVISAGYQVSFEGGENQFGGRGKSSTTSGIEQFNSGLAEGSQAEVAATSGESVTGTATGGITSGAEGSSGSAKGNLNIRISVAD